MSSTTTAASTPGCTGATGATTRDRLTLDPVRCDGRGLCHELLPELIDLDEWGFPVLAGGGLSTPVPDRLRGITADAVAACPVLALRLTKDDA